MAFLKNSLGLLTYQPLEPSVSRHHRRRRGPYPPRDILPIEIWEDGVLRDLPDECLLLMAAVCRTFNALCIPLYLSRNISAQIWSPSAEIQIASHILRALQLSCAPLPKERLICDFWHFGIPQNFAALRDVICKSSTLREVTLKFSGDLLYAHKWDHKIPTVIRTQRGMMNLFCAVLSAMALKTPGPIVVVSAGTIFTGRAEEVADWRLDDIVGSSGNGRSFFSRIRWQRPRKVPPAPMPRTPLHRNPETTRAMVLTKLLTTSVYSHRGTRAFTYTLMIFNVESITTLYLIHVPLSAAQLSAILPTLQFPALLTAVVTDGLEPAILGEFLVRHSRLTTLEYEGASRGPNDTARLSCLISPPLTHPSLAVIRADGVEDINHVMESVHISPLLNSFRFSCRPSASQSSGLLGLNHTFRLISQRSNDVHLVLRVLSPTKDADAQQLFFMDEEASAIARALRCIRSVKIICWSVEMGLKTGSWLALFPALRSVAFEFELHLQLPRNPQIQVELTKFTEQVKAVLPRGVEIEVDSIDSWL
ncbi:hypothetical protein B0H11DRAFT_2255611 [Mycena galericulata]|nr:hypothetical protein B0H11DRAFT_2255611 [Mycena galericulata]